MNAPTMLIGLGGLGCQVVDMVYGRIPLERRQGVGFHGFDTNVNDIKKCHNIAGHITQTSTRKMVGQYVHEAPSVEAWFPKNRILYEKTLENGAGQIRVCSRLAFRAKMEEANSLTDFLDDLKALFPVQGEDYLQGVRVLVVSSLAGGTGSGIFLQLAMNIRDIMDTYFERDQILIRGAFILPDVLIKTKRLDPKEHLQVRANTYASLKELNAITRAARGSAGGYSDDVTIELEYKPNQVDLSDRTIHAITRKQLPYNFCFLYDYENSAGENLKGSLNSYMEQIARSVYVQLFSPIADDQFSKEDNLIRETIRNEGVNIYCGSGVSTLVYPYEHIIEYCALKWSISSLDESWLLLDKIYQDEKKAYEADLRMGLPRVALNRGQRYIDDMNAKLQGDNPPPFLRYIEQDLRLIDDKGNKGKYKADLFIDAMKRRIDVILLSDEKMTKLENKIGPDLVRIKVKEKAIAEIIQVEGRLEELRQMINRKVSEYKTIVYYELMGLDAHSDNQRETREYSLNTWTLAQDKPMHPVAVRYFLYQLEMQLEQLNNALKMKNDENRDVINAYKRGAFDLADTLEKEDAAQRIRMAFKQGFIGTMFKNEFKEFIEEYLQKSSSQRNALAEYKHNYLLELVSSSLLKDIRDLIAIFERFFANLADTRNSLINDVNRREVEFDGYPDPTMDYVLATSSMFQKVWGEKKGNLQEEDLPDEIAEQIYLSLYKDHVRTQKGENVEPTSVEALYREQVLAFCRRSIKDQFRDDLDINVIRALRKEAKLKGLTSAETDKYIEDRIKPQLRKALPFIQSAANVQHLSYWGLHPDSARELNEGQRNSIFDGVETGIIDSAFSRYEICAYQALYGLSAEQLGKFSSGETSDSHKKDAGEYFRAYKNQINRLVKEGPDREVTPHLDKRWHLPAFLPDINHKEMERDLKSIDQAMILGHIYDILQLVEDQHRWVYQFKGLYQDTSFVFVKGEKVKGTPVEIYKALGHNPAIVEYILSQSEELRQKSVDQQLPNVDMKKVFEGHEFIKRAFMIAQKGENKPPINILDLVFNLDQSIDKSKTNIAETDQLLKCLIELIEKYYADCLGQNQDIEAKMLAAGLIQRLWEQSYMREQTNHSSATYKRWENIIGDHLTRLVQEEEIPTAAE